MPETVVAADENVEGTYLRRLFEVLGVKGAAMLAVVPVALAASSLGVGVVRSAFIAAGASVVFLVAVVLDSRRDPSARVDIVGVSILVVALGYTALLLLGLETDWTYAVGGAGLVLGAVGYDYLSHGDDGGVRDLHESEVDPLHVDVVGFVAAEVLAVYAVLQSTGWGTFANSPVFVVLAYIIYISTVAAFAGYAVITREIVVSRTADEVHDAVMSVLEDIADIENLELRRRLALNIRRVAECLDGVRLPTRVEDEYGRVPAVVSTRKPEVRRIDMRLEDVTEAARKAEFTGYVIHNGVEVSIFRNGDLAKYYVNGRYVEDTADILDRVSDVSFYSTEYSTVKDLIDITPGEGEVRNPERAMEDIRDKEVEENAIVGENLKVGGEEVNVSDMFTITEEIVEESSKEEDENKLEVGGNEVDVDEIMDQADDVIDELSGN